MISCTLRLGLLALGVILPTAALAQADQILRNPDGTVVDPVLRYPDGTVVDPVLRYPDGTPVPATAPIWPREVNVPVAPRDVDGTGSVLSTLPLPQRDMSVTIDRPGCAVQSYAVSPSRRVRVHRC